VGGFLFRLETPEGVPADPPTLEAAVPDWRSGHSIHFGGRTLLVVGTRDDDADQPPVLIVGRRPRDSPVSAEQVALIPRCAECDALWLPADENRWCAYLTDDEPAELVFYCPVCAEQAFGGD